MSIEHGTSGKGTEAEPSPVPAQEAREQEAPLSVEQFLLNDVESPVLETIDHANERLEASIDGVGVSQEEVMEIDEQSMFSDSINGITEEQLRETLGAEIAISEIAGAETSRVEQRDIPPADHYFTEFLKGSDSDLDGTPMATPERWGELESQPLPYLYRGLCGRELFEEDDQRNQVLKASFQSAGVNTPTGGATERHTYFSGDPFASRKFAYSAYDARRADNRFVVRIPTDAIPGVMPEGRMEWSTTLPIGTEAIEIFRPYREQVVDDSGERSISRVNPVRVDIAKAPGPTREVIFQNLRRMSGSRSLMDVRDFAECISYAENVKVIPAAELQGQIQAAIETASDAGKDSLVNKLVELLVRLEATTVGTTAS